MKFSNQLLQRSLNEDWGPHKRVTISEFPCQRIYTTPDLSYEASKWYSSADRTRFKEEAIRDGFRIRRLISSCPLPTGRAVQELLMNGVLTREDLLGIDHLCSLRLAEKVLNERRSHINLVLSAQEELKRANGLVDSEKLAVIAVKGSVGNVAKARQRAVLAKN
jgi:hypothetical protein